MTRRRRRNTYEGCSLTSHNGKLRLEWRVPDPARAGRYRKQRWATGDADTPETREKWEEVRCLVGKLRMLGEDPALHLQARAPKSFARSPGATNAPTIRSFYEEWIAAKVGQIRPALLKDYRLHFTNYVLADPLIADTPLASLRPMDVQLFQSRLRARVTKRTRTPLSEKTVQCVIGGSLRAMIRDASVQDLVTRDVFVGLTWKTWNIPPADPLAPEEWEKIDGWFRTQTFQRHLTWRPHPAFHAYVFFLRWHGARPSEASALTWDNVDLQHGIAYIRASYHYREVGEPKTRAARRSIELHPQMVEILRDLRPLRPEPGQPVFPNLDGRRISPRVFWDTWKRGLQACRIRHRGLYSLKDTFVTHTLAVAEESGEGQRLTAWLVRQTGVRLDTLKQHYERWWPRDRDAIHATYAMLDPDLEDAETEQIAPQIAPQAPKRPYHTANRKWMMSPSWTT